MAFKTILAVIQEKADVERVLDCALPLAGRCKGYIIGVHAETLPIAYSGAIGFPDAEFMQAAAEANKVRAAEMEAAFRARLADSGFEYEWRSLESYSGDSAMSALASARAADLVVAAQHDPETGEAGPADLDSLLYSAGRPVLVVPAATPAAPEFRRVLVAWNGSRSASRAVFDALPLLKEAQRVVIFVVDPPEEADTPPEASGADIAAALARHGVEVTVATARSGGAGVDETIRGRVEETGADLLVMGAYSHSWLREALFGGVTRAVLRSASVATLLSR